MKNPGYILVGFGDQRLTHLIAEIKEKPEKVHDLARLCMTEIPHYRSFSSSSLEEQKAFVDYMTLMTDFTKEKKE